MNNKGFTLFETLVYITCLALFALGFISVTSLYINIKSNISLLRYKINVLIGINTLIDDIRKAPDIKSFKFIDKNNLIYRKSDLDIGWILSCNNLYKYIGQYSNNSWVKKRKNLVLQNIESIDFKYNKNILSIRVSSSEFKNSYCDYQVFVLPRSGILI